MGSYQKIYQRISVERLTLALGAEIGGVQLANLDDETFREIEAAFLEHQVIFFRDQQLTRDQHIAFGRRFGELDIHRYSRRAEAEGYPELGVFKSDASDRSLVPELWHSDVSWEDVPPLGSILRCLAAPEVGGDTLWSSMYAAYDALSETMQRMLDGLVAMHDTTTTFSAGGKAATTSAEHPVVRTHPRTGRKALYVSPLFTRSIKGMTRSESEALLGFLFRHIDSREFTCRFHWRRNSIAMWDNRCTVHVASTDVTAFRHMERVTIKGDRPY
jgi:taurine dioxygenase